MDDLLKGHLQIHFEIAALLQQRKISFLITFLISSLPPISSMRDIICIWHHQPGESLLQQHQLNVQLQFTITPII